MLSVHTSPLDQPGTGDAGGMNVYVVEVAKRLAALGIEVEIFTRATTGACPPTVELAPGVSVRHVDRRALTRAWPRRTCPASCAPSPPACMRAEARPSRATTTWCTRTTGCPARSAGWPPSAGACRSCTPCTPWPRSRTRRSPTATPPSPPAASHRRDAGRRGRRPARRQHRRGGRASSSTSTARTRPGSPSSPPGSTSTSSRPGGRGRGPRARLGLPPDARRAAVRRPDPAAQGSRRAAARGGAAARRRPVAARAARRRRASAAPAAAASRTPGHLRRARRAARHRATSSASARRSRRTSSRTGTAPPRLVVPSLQRVVRPRRRRGAGLRHARGRGRGRRPADGRRRRRAGVLVDGHDPRVWARALAGLLDDPRRRAALGAAAVGTRAAVRLGRAPCDTLLDVYAVPSTDRPLRAVAARRPRVRCRRDLAVAP